MKHKILTGAAAALVAVGGLTGPALATDTPDDRPVKAGWTWTDTTGVEHGTCADGYSARYSEVPKGGTFTVEYKDGTTKTGVSYEDADRALREGLLLRDDPRALRYSFDAGYETIREPRPGYLSEGDCIRDDHENPGSGENTGDDGDFPPAKPEQPSAIVERTEWVDVADPTCDAPTVEQTRTVTTTEHVWDGEAWVPGEPVTETETRTRDLTEAEVEACTPEPSDGGGEQPAPEPTDEPTEEPQPEPGPAPEPSDEPSGPEPSDDEQPTPDEPTSDAPVTTPAPALVVDVQPAPSTPQETPAPVEQTPAEPTVTTTDTSAAPTAADTTRTRLPRTGSEALPLVTLFVVLLAGGGGLLLVARRLR